MCETFQKGHSILCLRNTFAGLSPRQQQEAQKIQMVAQEATAHLTNLRIRKLGHGGRDGTLFGKPETSAGRPFAEVRYPARWIKDQICERYQDPLHIHRWEMMVLLSKTSTHGTKSGHFWERQHQSATRFEPL